MIDAAEIPEVASVEPAASSTQSEIPLPYPGALASADSHGDGPDDVSAEIRRRATQCVARHILRNGDKGWPFSRIFTAEPLRGATEIWIIDPYLAKPHQRRNLREFLGSVAAVTRPKVVNIITREVHDPGPDGDKPFYDLLDRTFFEKAGLKITYAIDEHIHDRFVVLDNGYVFKLGRGIDIYKPVAGLAGGNPALRQTRACEIDVFAASEVDR